VPVFGFDFVLFEGLNPDEFGNYSRSIVI